MWLTRSQIQMRASYRTIQGIIMTASLNHEPNQLTFEIISLRS
ncbi:hypothetical protein Hanom_Chr07g00651401 [Helianthus anomalus]